MNQYFLNVTIKVFYGMLNYKNKILMNLDFEFDNLSNGKYFSTH
jgi:hypothetical protein